MPIATHHPPLSPPCLRTFLICFPPAAALLRVQAPRPCSCGRASLQCPRTARQRWRRCASNARRQIPLRGPAPGGCSAWPYHRPSACSPPLQLPYGTSWAAMAPGRGHTPPRLPVCPSQELVLAQPALRCSWGQPQAEQALTGPVPSVQGAGGAAMCSDWWGVARRRAAGTAQFAGCTRLIAVFQKLILQALPAKICTLLLNNPFPLPSTVPRVSGEWCCQSAYPHKLLE